jgi:hypothetical protein
MDVLNKMNQLEIAHAKKVALILLSILLTAGGFFASNFLPDHVGRIIGTVGILLANYFGFFWKPGNKKTVD